MGGTQPKFLLDLGGKSILELTLQRLHDCPDIDQIILVVPSDQFSEFLETRLEALPSDKISHLVSGGQERQHSIWHGIQTLMGESGDFKTQRILSKELKLDEDGVVVVHDAVRPFAKVELFSKVIAKARETGAAIVGIPIQDTIKKVHEKVIQKTLDRQFLFQAQTPQAFQLGPLYQAYKNALAGKVLGTDDASLLENFGREVHMVEGDKFNIKVTTPDDLLLARRLYEEEPP